MEKTRTRIIEAARKVLISKGSNGFSMRKVAEEASLSLSNVQYYFRTRAALLDGILSGFIEEYQKDLATYLEAAGTGRNALTVLIREILIDESKNDEIKYFRSLITFVDQDVLTRHLSDFYRDVYRLLLTGLAKLSGRAPESPQVHRAASLLLPFFNGYGMVGGSLGLDLDETARELSHCAWELIRRKK